MSDPSPLQLVALCLFGAVLLLPRRPPRRALAALGILALVVTLGPPLQRLAAGDGLRDYTFAHYRLGAKYSEELGYDGLYAAMLAADSAGVWSPQGAAPIDERRDLATYALVATPPVGDPVLSLAPAPAPPIVGDPVLSLAPAPAPPIVRDPSFAGEVAFFQPRLSPADWRAFFRDKGYNASPAWTASFGRLLAAVPCTAAAFTALALLDLALLVAAFAALGVAFGPLPALLCAAAVALFPGSEGNLVGGPLQLDWAAAAFGSLAAAARGRPLLAGALFGWAIASRLFPAFLLAGPLLAVAVGAMQARRSFARRAATGLALSLGVALLLGATTPRGPAAWAEFSEKITLHAAHHHEGDRRIGLDPLLGWAPLGERAPAEARQDRAQRWIGRAPWATAARCLLLVLWIAAASRGLLRGRLAAKPDGHALVATLLLALPVPFLLVTQSRYYALLPAALLLLPGRGPALLGASLLAIAGLTWGVSASPAGDATWYATYNAGLLAAALVALVRFGRRRR